MASLCHSSRRRIPRLGHVLQRERVGRRCPSCRPDPILRTPTPNSLFAYGFSPVRRMQLEEDLVKHHLDNEHGHVETVGKPPIGCTGRLIFSMNAWWTLRPCRVEDDDPSLSKSATNPLSHPDETRFGSAGAKMDAFWFSPMDHRRLLRSELVGRKWSG
jgi:hypothetical protein